MNNCIAPERAKWDQKVYLRLGVSNDVIDDKVITNDTPGYIAQRVYRTIFIDLKEPVLRSDWIEQGVHVSAFGTDTRDKNEVEAALFRRAKVVVDDVTQATTLGDTHHAVDQGLFRAEDIHATLGEILAGRKNGRTSDDEITLFDATGLAFQDLVAGDLAVKLAAENGVGTRVSLNGGDPGEAD